MELNEISGQIIDAAIKVHSALGPGLLESAYEACLVFELNRRGMRVQSQLPMPIKYEGLLLEVGYRIDLLVEGQVIVEIKTVSKLARIHQAQLLSYLKMSSRRLGLLLNFYELHLKDGIKRMVNRF